MRDAALKECEYFDIDFRFGFKDIVKSCFKQTCHLSEIFLSVGIANRQHSIFFSFIDAL